MSTRAAFAVLLSTLAVVSFSSCGDDKSPQGVLNVSGASGSLQVSCSVSPSAGFVPLTVNLTTNVQGNTPSYGLVVDFGDGTTGNNGNVSHVYGSPGGYTLRVVASAEGQTAECRQSVTAQSRPPAAASRPPVLRVRTNPAPAAGPAPLTVNFNLCTSQDPEGVRLSFKYNYGDGRVTDYVDACSKEHTYAAGSYVALLCVTDGEPGHDVCGAVDVVAQ
jgi:PKD repeat protein